MNPLPSRPCSPVLLINERYDLRLERAMLSGCPPYVDPFDRACHGIESCTLQFSQLQTRKKHFCSLSEHRHLSKTSTEKPVSVSTYGRPTHQVYASVSSSCVRKRRMYSAFLGTILGKRSKLKRARYACEHSRTHVPAKQPHRRAGISIPKK